MPWLENHLVIAAPPAKVWAVLTDQDAYATWNPRLRQIDGALAVGAVVVLHYAKEKAWWPAVFTVDVDACEPERELRWSGPRHAARQLMRASHWFRLAPHAQGTQLSHGERFDGVLAPVLWPLIRASVEKNHAAVNEALRARCETSPARTPD